MGSTHKGGGQHTCGCNTLEWSAPLHLSAFTGQSATNNHSSSPSRPSYCVQTKLDILVLDRTVDYYFQNGLAASTQCSYNLGKRRYLKFCQIKGSAPVPASEHQLCQLVAFLANEKLCHNTIKGCLAAIRHLHIAEGAGDLASSPGSFLKNGGRRELGNIREKSCRLLARHHSCDQRRTLPL